MDDLLNYKNIIVIGATSDFRKKLISVAHDSHIRGHVGIQNSYRRLKTLLYWPFMKKTVKQIVNGCDICKQAKLENIIYLGLLQPLPVSNGVWRDITMDFIEGLLRSEGKDTILVIVD